MHDLLGGRCTTCGHTSWPLPNYCSEGCGATIETLPIANTGIVYASTTIRVPHPVFGDEYQVGYVDLEAGPRIFGHFQWVNKAKIGTAVRIDFKDIVDLRDDERLVRTVVFSSLEEEKQK